MLESLRNRINQALGTVRGSNKLSEKAVEEALRQVRRALLEADVALPVAREFIDQVRLRASGAEVLSSLTPAQTMIGIVHEELTRVIGDSNVPLNLSGTPPVVILIAGLQGSGKTTTVGKLARILKREFQKRVMVASVDVYRPAAVDQLRKLAEMVEVDFYETDLGQKPQEIARSAIAHARSLTADVVIIDSAGRLHIDDQMMDELRAIHADISPDETLFVIDAMTGQDAVNSASAFNDALPLSGVVVTKLDSDTRGGALLSVRHITGKPVKFIGVGEAVDALEQFHPDRIASRILGMGDVLSLIESAQQKADKGKAQNLEQKLRKGRRFDLGDYRDQMMMAQDMGGMSSIAKLLPGLSSAKMPDMDKLEESTKRDIAIINSMTPHERRHPAIIRGSRRVRICAGSGVEARFVNQLLRKFDKMQKMTRKFSQNKGKMSIPGMDNLSDKFPMQ